MKPFTVCKKALQGVEEIDTIMETRNGASDGSVTTADFIGLDVCHSILKVLHEGFEIQIAPCALLTNM